MLTIFLQLNIKNNYIAQSMKKGKHEIPAGGDTNVTSQKSPGLTFQRCPDLHFMILLVIDLQDHLLQTITFQKKSGLHL
ncbi:MAG TPA: hypothetical protein DHV48_14640 [Prolixibacteraceae bacterium]|nr:hypothetical protein [Prolixibacteraceae bacterium]